MKKTILTAFTALAATAGFAQFSIQKVVLEEFTGAWCQYCPDGAVIAENINQAQANAIVFAVHSGDAMEVQEGSDLAATYSPAYPQALINRTALLSRGSWSSSVNQNLQGASAVTVSLDSVEYDPQTRQLSVTVRAMFTGPESGDLRLNLAIFEDHVTGTGSGYNQVNYYNNVAGHPYYGAGSPIIGFDHRHVLRTMLGGAWGDAGLLPTSVNFGTTGFKRYTYTLPANWKAWDVGLAGFVQRYDSSTAVGDRDILNGEEFYLNTLVVGNDRAVSPEDVFVQAYPNPSSGLTKIAFNVTEPGMMTMEVINLNGARVAVIGEGYMNEGMHTLNWNGADANGTPVANGLYLVRLVSENQQVGSTRLMIAK